jgi:hypothetical protein
VRKTDFNPPCSIAGRRNSLRTELPPSGRKNVPAVRIEEKQKRIEFLEKKVQRKDEVLVELMTEHVALKKSLGVAAKLAGIPTGESPGVELTQLPT